MCQQTPNATQMDAIHARIVGMIQHENELINHRVSWFLTFNGLLFAAFALHGDGFGAGCFILILAVIGITTAVSFFLVLMGAEKAINRLKGVWDEFGKRNTVDIFGKIDVLGHEYEGWKKILGWLHPWCSLPVLLAAAWAGILFLWLAQPTSPGPPEVDFAIRRFDDTPKPTVHLEYRGTADRLCDFFDLIEVIIRSS